jgi:hypothetical protein
MSTHSPGPVLRPWAGARADRRYVSDAARYRQAGNAVAVPAVAELTAALTGEPEVPGGSDLHRAVAPPAPANGTDTAR